MTENDIKPYKNQVFSSLRSKHLASRTLFVDEHFPPVLSSIAKYQIPNRQITWKRPYEIVNNPQFFVDGADPNDLDQGEIGNCWFIAGAIAIAIASNPVYLNKVVPNDQSFDNDYCGIFHFRFWVYGQWFDVVIDDSLPVDRFGKLIYCRNKRTKNEFWCSLLEKAYAKLSTCYEFLIGGFSQDAMIDMSGGVNESFELSDIMSGTLDRNYFWKILKKASLGKSIIGASIYPKSGRETILYNGLVEGHAYSITKLIEVVQSNTYYRYFSQYNDQMSHPLRLIRVKNPWNNHIEWNGRFSDSSSEWHSISDKIKKEIGLVKRDDGEFWMSFDDFLQHFSKIDVVHINMNAFYNEDYLNRKTFQWKCKMFHDEWNDYNSGGCGNYDLDSFYKNPQYLINLKDPDLDDNDNKASLIVSLMQKETIERRNRNYGQINEEPFQFRIFRLLNDTFSTYTNQGQFKFGPSDLQHVDDSGHYAAYRVISKRFKLNPGYYVIIPSTFKSGVRLKFLLRLFTEIEV